MEFAVYSTLLTSPSHGAKQAQQGPEQNSHSPTCPVRRESKEEVVPLRWSPGLCAFTLPSLGGWGVGNRVPVCHLPEGVHT